MKRILIVNPFGIGDVLFTTPMIESIKAQLPDSYIGYICNIRTAPLLLTNPDIDDVFIFEKDEYRYLWQISKLKCLKKLYSFFKEIKAKRFDAAFDLSLAQEFGLFLTLAGIRERIGYNYRNRGIFLNKRIDLANGYSGKHMVDYYLSLLWLAGIKVRRNLAIRLNIPQQDKIAAEGILLSNGIVRDEPFICIAPGGGASWGATSFRKQWPKENFAEVASALCEKNRLKVVLLGGADDRPICAYIKEKEGRCIDLCAETTLLAFAAIVKKAKLLVTNDGGPLHIAVAVDTRTVSIFGPVDERVYGPYPASERHIVIKNKNTDCRPCYKNFKIPECSHHSCLNGISLGEVIEAVEKSYRLTS